MLGLLALVIALRGLAGPFAPIVGFAGLVLGVATVFLDERADEPADDAVTSASELADG